MESEVESSSRICPIIPSPNKGLNRQLNSRPIFVAVSLSLILLTSGLLILHSPTPIPPLPPPPLPPLGIPHGAIAIDGDANFSATALSEGWPGDGSPENPYVINGLDIYLGGNNESCIVISDTRVSFTISNCNCTSGNIYWEGPGPEYVGISLDNVANGKLVNNICKYNDYGIRLSNSYSNTVANNTCTGNILAIYLYDSYSNTVANNTCNNNRASIELRSSVSNTVANNTCNNNFGGITILSFSDSNTVANNTCNNNRWGWGIGLWGSDSNTVTNNTCNDNPDYGIRLDGWDIGAGGGSDSNTVANNICTNSDIGISVSESSDNTVSDNTCNSDDIGIRLFLSDSNTVENNVCYINDVGISLNESTHNTLTNNICNDNRIGIYLDDESEFNIVENNTFWGNTEHDIVYASELEEELLHREYVGKQFVWFLAGCGMILVVAVIALVRFRRMEI
ncbi:MAG: nitrous oxide reductase family maturation protein NosD [Promethearchaeota archaeon]